MQSVGLISFVCTISGGISKATRLAAERIDSAIDYMRKGVNPLYVKVV